MPHHPCACYQKLLALDFLKVNGTFSMRALESMHRELGTLKVLMYANNQLQTKSPFILKDNSIVNLKIRNDTIIGSIKKQSSLNDIIIK